MEEETGQELPEPETRSRSASARRSRSVRSRAPRSRSTRAGGARAGAVRRPGVHLQRRDVQPRHAVHDVLRRVVELRPGVHHRLRDRQLPRAADARAAVRHRGPQADDRRHLPGLGGASPRCWRSCSSAARSAQWAFEALVVATFFLASAGASAAYLTVSEIFPMETRALAIAFFYAVGTARRRHHRPAAVRPPDRQRRSRPGHHRVPDRRRRDGARRDRRAVLRRQGRAGRARGHRQAADREEAEAAGGRGRRQQGAEERDRRPAATRDRRRAAAGARAGAPSIAPPSTSCDRTPRTATGGPASGSAPKRRSPRSPTCAPPRRRSARRRASSLPKAALAPKSAPARLARGRAASTSAWPS